MCNVAALAGLTKAVALDGPGEDNGGRAFVLDRGAVSGIDLEAVVAAKAQTPQFVVAQVSHHPLESRVNAPEVLANVGATCD